MLERPRWFIGESQLDQDEYGFDGTIWEPPDAKAQSDESSPEGKEQGYIAEPYLIAEGIKDKEDAELICRAVHAFPVLLAAAKNSLRIVNFRLWQGTDALTPNELSDWKALLETAIAKAEGA